MIFCPDIETIVRSWDDSGSCDVGDDDGGDGVLVADVSCVLVVRAECVCVGSLKNFWLPDMVGTLFCSTLYRPHSFSISPTLASLCLSLLLAQFVC